jgi:hypothetical protein
MCGFLVAFRCIFIIIMTLLDHRNTATTKKLDFKNSHLTSVEATELEIVVFGGGDWWRAPLFESIVGKFSKTPSRANLAPNHGAINSRYWDDLVLRCTCPPRLQRTPLRPAFSVFPGMAQGAHAYHPTMPSPLILSNIRGRPSRMAWKTQKLMGPG